MCKGIPFRYIGYEPFSFLFSNLKGVLPDDLFNELDIKKKSMLK